MPERWWLRPLLLLGVVSAGVVLALTVGIPPIDELRSGVVAAGWAAPVLYAAIFAGLTLTPAPASVASIAAGVLFGFATGWLRSTGTAPAVPVARPRRLLTERPAVPGPTVRSRAALRREAGGA